MKNKFKSLLNVRANEAYIQEKRVVGLMGAIKEIEVKVSNLENVLNNVQMPTNGKLAQIIMAQGTISLLRREIDELSVRKKILSEELIQEQDLLKHMNIEHEKAKYLFEQEQKAWIKYIEKKEQEELDDVGQKLYL